MTHHPNTTEHVDRLKRMAATIRSKEETLRRMKLPISAAAEARKAERVEQQIAMFDTSEMPTTVG
jgi:hypothetical protein